MSQCTMKNTLELNSTREWIQIHSRLPPRMKHLTIQPLRTMLLTSHLQQSTECVLPGESSVMSVFIQSKYAEPPERAAKCWLPVPVCTVPWPDGSVVWSIVLHHKKVARSTWSGHIPRLWVQSLAGSCTGGNWWMFLSSSPPLPPFSL